jgi:predicted nucleotidyltransferase
MNKILQIPLNKVRQESNYKELLESLERGFNKFNIDFYLVGATARDVWMRGLHEMTPKRATSDIDFGIMINSSSQFAELKDYLIKEEGFTPTHDNSFVLIWNDKDKTQVDLIPFGDVEREGIVTVKGTGMISMNVEGFKEVFDSATEEINTEGQQFKVCTLAGIVILKLIAWDDRPESRRDDVGDIAEIIKKYFHFNSEAIWEHHSDLFVDDKELEEIAGQYLGREIGGIISGNQKLINRVNGILEKALHEDESNVLIDLLASESNESIDFSKSIISHILVGINEIIKLQS